MKILILSFYYYPDLSAGSFRATALVKAVRQLDPACEIDVITTLPNRYRSFSAEAKEFESADGVSITRIAVPKHSSGMLDQSKSFITFARRALKLARCGKYDLVFATSSRLMTAVLGALTAKLLKAPLYLDIRDIFVDTIKDVLPRHFALLFAPFFGMVERLTAGQAKRVNLVSRGFAGYFSKRYPSKDFSFIPNGVDDEFVKASPDVSCKEKKHRPVTVVYAGNLGEGQGLHTILPELGKRMAGEVEFKIFGDGGRRMALESAIAEAGISNVNIFSPVNRSRLIEEYQNADVLFLHLNNYDAFKKVLPSKIFEYAAMGKPIWAGIPGYSAEFVLSEIGNAVVFPPCDVEKAVSVFNDLVIRDIPRTSFIAKYSRESLSLQLAQDILALIPKH